MTTSDDIRALIARTKVDETWSGRSHQLLHLLTSKMAETCESVIDIGKSSRECWSLFSREQVISADINQYEGYPDIIVDICDASSFPERRFDGVICHSILEHVYDPHVAVRNLYNCLSDGGVFLGFAPFLLNYHAPKDLKFQDFYRFSRDGLAYLFRDFEDVTLFPVRGRCSSIVSLIRPLKQYRTKGGSEYLSNILDRLIPGNSIQTSGYIVHAIKAKDPHGNPHVEPVIDEGLQS